MEMMVSELIQQNKKMESMMMSMTTEMKSLRQEVTHLRNNEPTSSALMVLLYSYYLNYYFHQYIVVSTSY